MHPISSNPRQDLKVLPSLAHTHYIHTHVTLCLYAFRRARVWRVLCSSPRTARGMHHVALRPSNQVRRRVRPRRERRRAVTQAPCSIRILREEEGRLIRVGALMATKRTRAPR